MAEGHAQDAWGHTSSLLAMVHNCDWRRKKMKGPAEFDPTRLRDAQPLAIPKREAWDILRKTFTGTPAEARAAATQVMIDHGP